MSNIERMTKEIGDGLLKLKNSLADMNGQITNEQLDEVSVCLDSAEFYLKLMAFSESKQEIQNAIDVLKSAQ